MITVVAIMIFSVVSAGIAPPVIMACDCASGDNARPHPPDALVKTASSRPAAAGCCTPGCPPDPHSDNRFAVIDIHCDTNASCCRAPGSGPQQAVNQYFLNSDYRPSFNEIKFKEALPSAFMSGADPVIFRTILEFERNLTWIPPHISSTILLL
jgi:hypothetical protein